MKTAFFIIATMLGIQLQAVEPQTNPINPNTNVSPNARPGGSSAGATSNARVGNLPNHAKSNSWLKDQNDQTDTYAIPLDDSEEEERQEEKEFERIERKKQGR